MTVFSRFSGSASSARKRLYSSTASRSDFTSTAIAAESTCLRFRSDRNIPSCRINPLFTSMTSGRYDFILLLLRSVCMGCSYRLCCWLEVDFFFLDSDSYCFFIIALACCPQGDFLIYSGITVSFQLLSIKSLLWSFSYICPDQSKLNYSCIRTTNSTGRKQARFHVFEFASPVGIMVATVG